MLNFQGRVQISSVKNFQIVHQNDLYYIVMQFGKSKIGDLMVAGVDSFSVDCRYPMSLVQVMGVLLTSFDAKIACE